MRILCITDLHGSRTALARILEHAGPVDLILLGGDITHFGTPNQAAGLVEHAQMWKVPVLAVAGNCDSAKIDRRLAELGVGLHGRGRVVDGVGFQGLSAMPPWLWWMYQFTEEELAHLLAAGLAELRGARPHVVLSHAPPRDSGLDRLKSGRHVGSRALADFIERHRPDLVVCGHIHEARGMASLGATTVVNCGVGKKGCYAIVEVGDGVTVDLRRAVAE